MQPIPLFDCEDIMKARVFISSTVFDLIDIRAELEDMIRELGLSPVLSDSNTADFFVEPNANSIESCLSNVRNSDYFLVILSQRYGPRLGKVGFDDVSATHLEYREARKNNIPLFFYVRDRLESDYRIWKKNQRKSDIKTVWVQNENNYGLFELIDEHQTLYADREQSNWYQIFRTSTDLKEVIRRDLRLPAAKVSLKKAIMKNMVPMFHGKIRVTEGRHDLESKFNFIFQNFGNVPAYNVQTQFNDEKFNPDSTTPVIPPGASIERVALLNHFGNFENKIVLKYQTPEGHHVKDIFGIKVIGSGNVLAHSLIFKEKIYKIGTSMPFKIIEE